MSLLERKPLKLPERACGLCRFFAPWIGKSELLGTCGGQKFGECVDKFDTCAGYEAK